MEVIVNLLAFAAELVFMLIGALVDSYIYVVKRDAGGKQPKKGKTSANRQASE